MPIADASTPSTPTPPPTPAVSMPPVDPLLIDAQQLAVLLGVHVSTINRMKAAVKLPRHIELSRGCHRWRLSEVRAWIEAGCPSIKEWEARNANGRRR